VVVSVLIRETSGLLKSQLLKKLTGVPVSASAAPLPLNVNSCRVFFCTRSGEA